MEIKEHLNEERLRDTLAQVLCGWRDGVRSEVPFRDLSKAEKKAYLSQAQDALDYLRPYLRPPERESGNQPLEFRMDEDGELDEIVGTCDIHLERMAGNGWFLAVYRPGTQERAVITLHAKSQEIKPVISEPMPVEQGRQE